MNNKVVLEIMMMFKLIQKINQLEQAWISYNGCKCSIISLIEHFYFAWLCAISIKDSKYLLIYLSWIYSSIILCSSLLKCNSINQSSVFPGVLSLFMAWLVITFQYGDQEEDLTYWLMGFVVLSVLYLYFSQHPQILSICREIHMIIILLVILMTISLVRHT